ncbi:polysaccharide biosynthesis protein [Paenibacillus sp. UMB7766-LJ446]|uniref:putative polysaccharide biosynthesis protein n=1 Tax=unclassified Paenibacillus TaxID=185978 RepID=UPI000464625C|nr:MULTISPECIES: polysaccharide biosynthesis protein [unclassified Paenibacillus]KGP81490.1 membrane protein [Paenibacillus sp. MAEPY1]KGP81511.1 membrane protein [Paenibacillus sp. MAEPY2]MDK8192174.1 polysaccharide biosynthesis protein [Paenibacillus sp. UMB7766-LJ446]
MSKKETFIKGTLILAAAALIARVLGLVQRVPLEHILGDIGNASFTISNTVYLMLLTVATAGIPSTLSKMVSERYALGRASEAQQIYRAALIFAAVAGVVMSALLWFAAPYYATYVSKVPESVSAIRALAPALLLFPAIAMMRGYFQGRGNMTAGGISQIVEQFARVGTAIIVAFVMLQWNYDDQTIAAGASFGGVFGSIGAFAVMLYFTLKLRKNDRAAQLNYERVEQLPMRGIYSDIFKLSIPIVLSSLAVPAINFIDSSLVVPLLSGRIGLEEATGVLAILGAKAQSIAGIPPILAIALSQSLVPVISAAFARKDEVHLKNQVTLALRISILTGMPIVIALCAAAYSVNGLLFTSPDGTPIITLLTFGTIFQITMMTTNSILLGVGKPRITMISVAAGIVVKLVASLILAPIFGIYGIIIATALCFLVITYLNLRVLRKIVDFSIMGDRWKGFIITVLLAAGVGFAANWAGNSIFDLFLPTRVSFLVTCLFVGALVVVVYLVLMVVLRVLRKDELGSYPRILQKILRPLMRLQRGAGQRG